MLKIISTLKKVQRHGKFVAKKKRIQYFKNSKNQNVTDENDSLTPMTPSNVLITEFHIC